MLKFAFRQKLEEIAEGALQSNSVGQIQKLFDQYVNFISLEDEMFCLKQVKKIVSFVFIQIQSFL